MPSFLIFFAFLDMVFAARVDGLDRRELDRNVRQGQQTQIMPGDVTEAEIRKCRNDAEKEFHKRVNAFCEGGSEAIPLVQSCIDEQKPLLNAELRECDRPLDVRQRLDSVPTATGGVPTYPPRPARASTPTQRPQQTPQNTTPQPPANAQNEATSDLNSCQSSMQQAQKCCNDPASCLTGEQAQQYQAVNAQTQALAANGNRQNANGGLTDYCKQLQQVGGQSSQVNTNLAAVCVSRQSSCQNTCSTLVSKYQGLLNNCSGCESQSIYQNTLQALQGGQSTCRDLSQRVDQLASQTVQGANGSAYANACNQQGGVNPSSLGGLGGGSGDENSQVPNKPTNPNDCQANPNSPQCLSQKPAPSPAPRDVGDGGGGGGFVQGDSATPEGSFNLTDGGGSGGGYQYTGNAGVPVADPLTYNTVANNSGGSIPGGGGGGGAGPGPSADPQASVAPAEKSSSGGGGGGSGGGGGGSGGGTGFAEADAGGSGEGSQAGGSEDGSGEGSGGQFRRGPASVSAQDPMSPTYMDLKQYLPGGSRDPYSRLGGNRGDNPDIHGKHVNIWNKISERLTEKCRLGILFGCS